MPTGRVVIDVSEGCGPIWSGFSRYVHGLMRGLSAVRDCRIDLRFITDLAPSEADTDGRWLVAPESTWQAVLEQEAASVYHDLTSASDSSLLLAMPHGVRTIVTLHDAIYLTHYLRAVGERESAEYTSRMSGILEKCAAVVTVSEAARSAILREFPSVAPSKVAVIYPGIDQLFRTMDRDRAKTWCVRYGISLDQPFILNAGAYFPHKNLRTLLLAFEKVLTQVPNARLVLTGALEPEHAAYWYAFLLQHRLYDRVIITGRVTDEELVCLYNACSVFAYPSLVEGFGFPPLEAAYCGARVLASDIDVFHETLEGSATFLPPTGVDAWAERLIAILEGVCDGDACAGEKRRHKRFSWHDSAIAHSALYEAVLDGGGASTL